MFVMSEFLNILIAGIMDAIEEFFDALTVPSRRYTLYAFFVSLIFLGWSVVAMLFGFATFVDWPEALTCTLLLSIIVLIDSSTRSKIKCSLSGVKSLASRLTYNGNDGDDNHEDGFIDNEDNSNISEEYSTEQEVEVDGSGD